MRAALFRLTLLGLASASLLSACADSESTEVTEISPNARIIRGKAGALTPPTTELEKVAREFVADHGVAADQLRVAQTSNIGADTTVKFEQVVDGLRVYGAYAKANFDSNGQLVQLIDATRVVKGGIKAASITDNAALSAAMTELGYDAGAAFHRAPSVEQVIYVDDAGVARRGFVVETWAVAHNQLDETLVGADGKIVKVESRTANDTYRVYPVDPYNSPSTVDYAGPASWKGTGTQYATNIQGPNVKAYLDADANNAPDASSHVISDGNFLATADFSQQPSTATNKEVAVQNLFYLNNITHDILLSHGFNASQNNFEGDDPVLAEAQDGSGTDNANFSTPTTGSPRMQMYLWSSHDPNSFVTVGSTNYGAFASSFGAAVSTTNGALANVNDGVGTGSDGCEASPAGSLTGKIAVVDRGTCDFTVKVLNAQSAGAVAVVIANNVDGAAFAPGGTNRKVKIPSAMVSKADGATLHGLAGSASTLKKNPNPGIQLDGDLDSDIVYHEYGHGLTWRMIGSMSGVFAGAIGEGASDVNAFLINGNTAKPDIIGEYAFGDFVNGIRRYRYEGYPLTYKDWTGAEVHNDGEIYAAAMWKVRQNYFNSGNSQFLFDDWIRGLDKTPSAPTPEQMRDGMLQAVAGTGRECLVWKGFAAQGIGKGASGTVSRRGAVTIVESFDANGCP